MPEPTLPEEEPPVPVEEPQLEPCESLEEMIPVQTSASKRKLSVFADEGSTTNDEGCLVVYFSLLRHLIAPLACPLCHHSSLQIEKRKSQNLGFVQKLTVLCTSCKEDVGSSMSWSLLEDHSYEMNRRAVPCDRNGWQRRLRLTTPSAAVPSSAMLWQQRSRGWSLRRVVRSMYQVASKITRHRNLWSSGLCLAHIF